MTTSQLAKCQKWVKGVMNGMLSQAGLLGTAYSAYGCLPRSHAFARVLETAGMPDSFDEAYRLCRKCCGHYEGEARALWDIVRLNRPAIVHEVGRWLGATTFLLACAARPKQCISVDNARYKVTDTALEAWFARHGIEAALVLSDSREWRPDGPVDFVYIDGEHTGEAVAREIEAYQQAKLIGFHDFADRGTNNHGRIYPDVVAAIQSARDRYGWVELGPRFNSEVVFRTRLVGVNP